MSGSEREAEVGRLLDGTRPQVPADLAERAARRGDRLIRRRRAARRVLLMVLVAAVVAFTLWAVAAEPWRPPPADTTPPVQGW